MSQQKIETIRSVSSGMVGRAISTARGPELVLDSSSHPHDDVLTNSEAFLAAISSCGVTLIESYAEEQGIAVSRMSVEIEGVRTPATVPACFDRVSMRFQIAGVSQAQAQQLLEVYRHR
ncbi:MAG: OsmC family protein [Gammaproteobacteria bacterium]